MLSGIGTPALFAFLPDSCSCDYAVLEAVERTDLQVRRRTCFGHPAFDEVEPLAEIRDCEARLSLKKKHKLL